MRATRTSGSRSRKKRNPWRRFWITVATSFTSLRVAFHAQNPREPAGLTSPEEKTRFLGDVEPILRKIGDLGASHTIYNLLQILEFCCQSIREKF